MAYRWLYQIDIDRPDELAKNYQEELEWVRRLPRLLGCFIDVDGNAVADEPENDVVTERRSDYGYRVFVRRLGGQPWSGFPDAWEHGWREHAGTKR